MTKAEILGHLTTHGIVGIIRTAAPRDDVLRVVEALVAGGVRSVEITAMTTDAFGCIEEAAKRFSREEVLMGVGSVLDGETAARAIDAGAEYVVSPVTRKAVIDATHERDKVVLPGAFTPTEIYTAWELGGDLIKVFPATLGGLAYIRAVRAPLPEIPLFPTGGVTVENIGEFVGAGVAGIGLGNGLTPEKLVLAGDFKGISLLAGEFVGAYRAATEN